MTPERKLQVQNIFIIIGIALIFGISYNYLFYPHSVLEFIEAGSVSILIGLLVGILEEFVFARIFPKYSFLTITAIRTLIYSLLTSIILCFVLSIEISFIEKLSYSKAVLQYIISPLFKRDFIFSFTFIILMLFILQIILLVGRANFFRLLFGFHHKPREISRIIMFVDLKGSTSLAEKLSNKAYSSLIQEYFYDISEAIILYGGEIYQYVGDGIIVVWSTKSKDSKCIRSFYKMEEIIERKRKKYEAKFGVVPEFKAAIHAGMVVVTSVGKQKKEIVYHSDVMNTTARIEGKCNELSQNLLLSQDLLKYIKIDKDWMLKEKGEIVLRGKAEKLTLYGVNKLVGDNLVFL